MVPFLWAPFFEPFFGPFFVAFLLGPMGPGTILDHMEAGKISTNLDHMEAGKMGWIKYGQGIKTNKTKTMQYLVTVITVTPGDGHKQNGLITNQTGLPNN